MTIMTTSTAAAPRMCALPPQGSPFALPTAVSSWREQVRTVDVAARIRDAFGELHPTHNSIPAVDRSTVGVTTGVTPADNGRDNYGAAKQAAPPRGVPR